MTKTIYFTIPKSKTKSPFSGALLFKLYSEDYTDDTNRHSRAGRNPVLIFTNTC